MLNSRCNEEKDLGITERWAEKEMTQNDEKGESNGKGGNEPISENLHTLKTYACNLHG